MTQPKLLLKSSADVTTFASGTSFPTTFLRDALKDVETAMFFAKVYDLRPQEVAHVLQVCVPSPVVEALTNQADLHSQSLQDYLVEQYQDEDGDWVYPDAAFHEAVPGYKAPVNAEILPEVWKTIELTIAKSIKDVAETIGTAIEHMPGKTADMVFKTLAKVNAKRPTLGDYQATFHHTPQKRVLVVFDVSGSVSAETVRTIVDDVVGLAYEANAALVLISNTAIYYQAGGYSTDQVLADAEFGGTHYEHLAPLFTNLDWDVVISIADYDSSPSAAHVLSRCNGKIGQLFDVSLVNRSTYLAECLAPMATEVRPLLIASNTARLVY